MGDAMRKLPEIKKTFVSGHDCGVLTPWQDKEPLVLTLNRVRVPLFVVRYALGWNANRTPNVDGSSWVDLSSSSRETTDSDRRAGKTAPDASSPFKVVECDDGGKDTGQAMPLAEGTHYTLRSLRYGYLYAFYERDGKKVWQIFDRNWFELRPRKTPIRHDAAGGGLQGAQAIDEAQGEPVPRVQAGGLGMLTVTGEGPLWFAFSDHLLSEASLKKSADDEAFRNRHMRKFDPKAWLDTQKAPHAAPILDAKKWVSDFAGKPPKVFDFSLDPFQKTDPKNLEQAFHNPAILKQGAILALEDPAGIASDLAWLMMHRYKKFQDEPSFAKPSATAAAIIAMEEAIKTGAEEEATERAMPEAVQARSLDQSSYELEQGTGPEAFQAKYQKTLVKTQRLAAENLLTARDSGWAPFRSCYNAKAMSQWQQKAEQKLKDFLEKTIKPLADLHVNWMGSKRMYQVFRCHYHHTDQTESYMELLGRCIKNTQGWTPCRESYIKWLSDEAGIDSPKNLVMRALAANDKEILSKARDLKGNIDPRSYAPDTLISVYQKFDEVAAKTSRKNALASLLVELSGPLTKLVNDVFDGTAGHLAVALMSSSVGCRLTMPELHLAADQAHAYLFKQALAANPGLGKAQVNKALRREMVRAGIYNPEIKQKTAGKRWLALQPEADFKIKGKNMGKVIQSSEELEELAQSKWQKASGGTVRFGIAAGILQTLCMTKLVEDYAKAVGDARISAGFKLMLGSIGMAATTADLMSRILKNQAERILYLGRELGATSTKYVAEALEKWAVRVSIGLAVVASLSEAITSIREWNYGFQLRGILTGVSAVSGTTLAWAFSSTAAGPLVCAIILSVFVVCNLYLNATKDNKLKEWIRRSSFGTGSIDNKPYTTLSEELDNLDFAYGG